MENVNEGASLEFKWLKKRGVGGKNKDVRFYESFIYDGVEYMLYDCVYIYKEGLREPYLGKLTKIWERPDKTKRVKVHWFFRPEEISNWLRTTKTLDNEIFFASGEGHGLANFIPLETIAGKCNVVCVSKDARNPQPSDEQLKAADFVFYRTFDVRSCTILDTIDDEVGGIEIKFIYNREKGQKINPFSESASDTKEESPNPNQNTIISGDAEQILSKTLPNRLKDDEKAEDIPKLLERDAKPAGPDKSHDRPSKKIKSNDKTPPEEKHVEPEVARDPEKLTDLSSMKSDVELPVDGKSKVDNNPRAVGKSGKSSETGKSNKAGDKDEMKVSVAPQLQKVENKEKRKALDDSDKLHDRVPVKKRKPDDKKPPEEKPKHEDKLPADVNNLKASGTANETPIQKDAKISANATDVLEGKTLKKTKDDSSHKMLDNKLPGDVNNLKASGTASETPIQKDAKISAKATDVLEGKTLKKIKDDSSRKMLDNKLPGDVNNLKASGTANETPIQKDAKISAKAADILEGKTLKKTKDDSSLKMLDNKIDKSVQKLGNNTNGKDLVANPELSKGKLKSGFAVGSFGNKIEPKDEQSGEIKKKLSVNKSFKGSALSTDGDKKNKYREFVVTPKPNGEKASWFRQLPWEERLKNAYDQGTAILLYNVDPDYTSGEVEDIIWHAFNENCEAKIVQRTAVSSPHYGQALILLKTKEAAQRILTKLDEECLMLPNKRPLVGIPCPPISTKRNSTFFGHLTVDRARFQNQREDEAVSTSHFSQPNNIEYDMAMEWCLLQLRSNKWWHKIHKQHEVELKKLVTELQPKKA